MSVAGDLYLGMTCRPAHTTGQILPVVVVIGTDDTGFGGGVGVVEPRVGQQLAEPQHVVMRHGCGSGLDEVDSRCKRSQLVATPLQELMDGCGHEEGRHSTGCRVHGTEEGIHVLQSVEQHNGTAHQHHGPYLRQAAQVVERPTDDKGGVGRKALRLNEVLGIGQDHLRRIDHLLRLAGRAGRGKGDVPKQPMDGKRTGQTRQRTSLLVAPTRRESLRKLLVAHPLIPHDKSGLVGSPHCVLTDIFLQIVHRQFLLYTL